MRGEYGVGGQSGLEETDGGALVDRPYPWLIRRPSTSTTLRARLTLHQAAARRRELEEEAERARRSAPCSGWGLPDAAGLCPPCSYARRTDLLVQEAVDLAVAVRADLHDAEQVAQLTARCEADTRTLIADVCRRRGGDEVWTAYAAQEVAELVRDERRVAAMRRLMASEDAVAEADAAYEAALRKRPRDHRAAQAAADDACLRTADYLLRSRLGQLAVLRARMAASRSHRSVW